MPSCTGSTPSTWLMVSATCAHIILELAHNTFPFAPTLLTLVYSKVTGVNPPHCFSVKVDLDPKKHYYLMNKRGALLLDSSKFTQVCYTFGKPCRTSSHFLVCQDPFIYITESPMFGSYVSVSYQVTCSFLPLYMCSPS